MYENGLIRKVKLISRFMTSHTKKKITAILILPNILKSKGNQAIKFCQFVEYNVRNSFLQKSCRK